MPNPRKTVRRLPHILDDLSLVKRFVEDVPTSERRWRGFQKAAVEALDEVIFILLPSGLGLPCPGRVLPKFLEPYRATLPCRTKVIQKMVEGGLVAVPLTMPVCATRVPRKDIQPLLTAKLRAMPVCPKQVLPKNVQSRPASEVGPAIKRKK